MNVLHTFFKVWLISATNALQVVFINRKSNILFFIGKLLRLTLSLMFLFLIRSQAAHFGSYTTDQLIVFFLVFQWVDSSSQTLFRGVYSFGSLIRNGEFDSYLVKPLSPLARALLGQPDINDAFFLLPTTILSVWIALQLDIIWSAASFWLFVELAINGILLSTAIHIFIMALGIITVEVDGLVWLYRDIGRLARFPTSIYPLPLRWLLYFIIPVGLMISIPSEVLLGTYTWKTILGTIGFGLGFFLLSIWTWNIALKQYSSASS